MNKFFSVCLALLCVLSLASCMGDGGKAPAETTQASNVNPSTQKTVTASGTEKQKIAKLDFSLMELMEANCISNLLTNYKSVTSTDRTDNMTFSASYFLKDGAPAQIIQWKYDSGEVSYGGWYRGYEISKSEDGRVTASIAIDKITETEAFPYEEVFLSYMRDVTIELVREQEDCYVLAAKSIYSDPADNDVSTLTVDKETLAIRRIQFESEMDGEVEINITYDTYVDGMELLDGFGGKLKTVTVVTDIVLENGRSNVTVQKQLPANWELRPYAYEETALYLDADSTVEYKYPGDGKDYTVYVTNIMG